MSKHSKARRDHRRRQGLGSRDSRPIDPAQLADARDVINDGDLEEARDLVGRLARKFPSSPEAWGLQLDLAAAAEDMPGYCEAAERYLQLSPDDADISYRLAFAYLSSDCLMSCIVALRTALLRWPDHHDSDEAQRALDKLTSVPELFEVIPGESPAEREELALEHERVLRLMGRGEIDAARGAAEALAEKAPEFLSVHNNLAECLWLQGRTADALQVAHRVLERAPGNLHALAAAARYSFLLGRSEETAAQVAELKAYALGRPEKVSEVLAFLGDDEGVVALLDANPGVRDSARLLRRLGSAYANQGNIEGARATFREAERLDPSDARLSDATEDLERSEATRLGEWGETYKTWLSPAAATALSRALKSAPKSKRGQKLSRDCPELIRAAPLMLRNGDAFASKLVVTAALGTRQADLVEAVRAFSWGMAGPDRRRLDAAMALLRCELVSSGSIEKMWLGGKWASIQFFEREIHDETDRIHPPEVERLLMGGAKALDRGDPSAAEPLFQQALALSPDDPGIRHNLAVAIGMQRGRVGEAERMAEEIHARWPDYLLARCAVAGVRIREGRLDEAKALLMPLRGRTRLHRTEFGALASTDIRLLLACGEADRARLQLEDLAQIFPDEPQLPSLREALLRYSE